MQVQINGDTHGEVVSDSGVKSKMSNVPHTIRACTLMNVKHVWKRSMGVLLAYLT